MKKDYLWDKRGTPDPEIEKLENALQIFRSQHNAPPALPAQAISLDKNLKDKSPRFYRAIRIAAAACLLFITVFLGFWMRNSPAPLKASVNSPQTTKEQSFPALTAPNQETALLTEKAERADHQPPLRPLTSQDIDKSKAELPDEKSNSLPIAPSRANYCCQPNKTGYAKNIRRAKPVNPDAVQLNELKPDELYAYQQLMRALQITSSKLDLVRKKVHGANDKTNLSLSITNSKRFYQTKETV